jgi:hypothetical protein
MASDQVRRNGLWRAEGKDDYCVAVVSQRQP